VGPKHPVECHEIWEYDDEKLIQKLVGMIALCPDCHMVKHIGLARLQGRSEKALKHLMKVNSLKKKDAQKYIADAFRTWADRSEKKWALDISCLKKYGINE
jgi:nitrate/TMAO reductase-like tetraheme cytochrome c subunit